MKQRSQYSGHIIVTLIAVLALISSSAMITNASQAPGSGLVIDFDTIVSVPEHLRAPIQAAVASDGRLPSDGRLTVSALRVEGDWVQAILVPTYVVEAAWEVELPNDAIVEILGQMSSMEFSHYRKGELSASLRSKVPGDFADVAGPASTMGLDLLFPWTSGQYWYKTNGWHSTNAIDFQPVVRSNPPEHFAVLAASSGRLTEVCNDGTQSMLRVEHSEGTTQYLHLDVNAVRRDLLGQQVQRGQFLGLLYNGRVGERDSGGTHYQFWTACGYGTAVHLHFVLPNHYVTIDGHNANDVANSAWATQYRSSNTRIDGGGSTPNCSDGEGVILYEHSNYQGRCSRFTGDDGNIGDNTIGNDAASSIKVIGNYQADVFEHGDFGGTSNRFTGDDPDFGNDAIGHDRASSIRVSRRDSGGTSNCDGGQGVYLYEHSNYGGKCSKFTGDAPNPRSWYIGNDSASSIRIIGSYEATLYEHDEYNGASSTFTSDDSDLSNNSIGNDRASSIRVRARQSGGTSNCDGGNGAYLYEHSNYGGRCTKFTADAASPSGWYLGNDAASSIRFVGNYAATVYEHDNYNGVSSSFEADDPDFGNNTIGHDRVSSIRVRIRDTGPTSCNDGQFLAEYFNNRDLSGSPIFRRCESAINYNWGSGGPGHGVPNDNFSVRWTGRFWFANDGIYRFTTRTDDGVRLIVDGQTVLQEWRDMGATTFPRDKQLNSGMHTVRMEYYEHGGDAVAQLSWQLQSSSGSDSDDGRTLSYGSGLDGTINPARDRDDYYFDGSAGQAITLRMDKRDSSIDSYLELYNPDGSLLGQDDDNGGNLNARIAITLRQNGRHKVIAREYGSGTGGYRISLSRESVADPDDNRWISFGSTLAGTISPDNDEDWYYFSGTSGRSVSIRMNKVDSGLDPYLELYSPNGVRVASNDDGGGNLNSWLLYTLPSGGTYRIKARSWNLSSSGRYQLSLRSESNANLALNKGAWATSTEFSGVEPYRAFDGNMGTRWSSQFGDPQLIYVDLGSVRTFSQVVLKWETAYGRQYGIFFWTGSAWQQLYWTNSGDGGTDTINFTPARAQFVAMYGVQRGTQYGYSLWEFEIYDNTTLVLPLVPPDPDDKAPDTIEAAAPLAPNDDGKATLLLGDGPSGQENTPLEGEPAAPPTTGTENSRPSAFILYPVTTENAAEVPEEVLFQGIASDNDEAGESITEYRWTSSIDGIIGTTDIFRLLRTQLSSGRHIITFEARDNEGDWSQPGTTILVIGGTLSHRLYLPTVSRSQ